MTPNSTVSLALILSAISAIGVIVTIISTFKRDATAEQKRQMEITRNFVELNVKFDTLRGEVQNVLATQDATNYEVRMLSEKVVKLSERVESLYHYKNCLDKRITELEKEEKS